MAMCEICSKKLISARKMSFRGSQVTKKFLRKQKPNVKKVRIDDNGKIKIVAACTRCIRTQNKTKKVV